MPPASQLTTSWEGWGLVGGCREDAIPCRSFAFISASPCFHQQPRAGGVEVRKHPVLVQVPGPPPPAPCLGWASHLPFKKHPLCSFVQSHDIYC